MSYRRFLHYDCHDVFNVTLDLSSFKNQLNTSPHHIKKKKKIPTVAPGTTQILQTAGCEGLNSGWIPEFWWEKSRDTQPFSWIQKQENLIFLRHGSPVEDHLTWKTSATTRLLCMILPMPSETEITADSQECFHIKMYKNKLEFLRESPFLNN